VSTSEAALADTSVFIALETDRPLAVEALPGRLTVSAITIGELRAGVLAAGDPETVATRLDTLLWAMSCEPLPVDGAVADAWARLRIRLRDAGRRMPVNDSWIAATAIAHGIAVLTQDDDYDGVPGLTVIKV
jgi:predicted nucleic acid-binding protein